ncbi:hypothetical protein NECAME_06122 [Necator americanus]|uniref:Uncharacterized protein n=1 Tax=Necator americanus TaxID=51031 RepID=W2TY57_NECAM|nr:hypothetical protein NECAME_06122 [Necator americanus]ETN85957.1 hypothetical protein NECAME_06122 [Necator americanus]
MNWKVRWKWKKDIGGNQFLFRAYPYLSSLVSPSFGWLRRAIRAKAIGWDDAFVAYFRIFTVRFISCHFTMINVTSRMNL